MNNKKTHFYIKLYCPRTSLLFQENLKQSKYNLTSKSTKRTFKKEKIKIKESLYNFVRITKKNQVKNEERTIKRNKNKINKYISILNDANIDEGIVLNKYFAYVKRYNIEYEKSQKLKLEGELIPIKTQEKLIKNMKNNIKFFKSLSNNMLMKYMIENKEKFTQYLEEISSYKAKNSLSYNYNKRKVSINKNNISISKSNDTKTILKTFSNNDENKRYILSHKDNNNYNNLNTVSNLKLKIEDKTNKNNNKFLTPHSRNKSKDKNSGNKYSTISSNKGSVSVNNKYYTPFITKKLIKNCLENNKSNEILTSRSDYKLQNYKFPNASKKSKNKEIYKLTLD